MSNIKPTLLPASKVRDHVREVRAKRAAEEEAVQRARIRKAQEEIAERISEAVNRGKYEAVVWERYVHVLDLQPAPTRDGELTLEMITQPERDILMELIDEDGSYLYGYDLYLENVGAVPRPMIRMKLRWD